MRVVGLILIVLAILALSVHSVTYFAHEREVGPLGFFVWDISRPYTIVVNPIAGAIALAAGVGMLLLPHRTRTA